MFGKAFTEAYKQAAGASARQSAAAAANKKSGGLTVDEACKILGIEKNEVTKDQVGKKYDYLFDINSKEKSGSFYLQSKVYRAKERLMHELQSAEQAAAGTGPNATK